MNQLKSEAGVSPAALFYRSLRAEAPANGDQGGEEPSMAEIMAMAKAAMEKAEEAETKAEGQREVKETVKEEAEARGLELTEEQAQMIAGITIAELEKRGAFPDAEGSGEGEGLETGAPPPPAGEQPAAPPAGEVPAGEEPPKKKSLAERFRGA